MKISNIALAILSMSVLIACDCQLQVSGVILDEANQTPIADVQIGLTESEPLATSKADGTFEVHSRGGDCDEITLLFSNKNYFPKRAAIKNNGQATIYLQSKDSDKSPFFEPLNFFSLTNLEKEMDHSAFKEEKNACEDWILTSVAVKSILLKAEPIDESEWHDSFDHLSCFVNGNLVQNGTTYKLSINAGGWYTITSPDTTLRFGSFSIENSKYFLSDAWLERISR